MKKESKGFATILRNNTIVNQLANTSGILDEIPTLPNGFKIPYCFDGRIIWKTMLSPIFNQESCGSCYAYSTVTCLADKYCIQTVGQVKPQLNPLELAMCDMFTESEDENEFKNIKNTEQWFKDHTIETSIQACKGNSIYSAGRSLFIGGTVEDSCISYNMLANYNEKFDKLPSCTNVEGPLLNTCCRSLNETTCAPQFLKEAQRNWPVKSYYMVSNTKDVNILEYLLMLNMLRWGPVVMGFIMFERFIHDYDGLSIFCATSNDKAIGSGDVGHAVRVVGWGEDNKIPYWICANSWGVNWGDNGYFKIERKNKWLQMEYNHVCLWPVLMKDDGNMHFTEGKPLQTITESQIQQLASYKVDPVTFYLINDLPRIRAGELIGDITPVINASLCPEPETFWAFLIGSVQFPTPSGEYIGPLYSSWTISNGIKYKNTNIQNQLKILNVSNYSTNPTSGHMVAMVIIYCICLILFIIFIILYKKCG
jgi:cathepsin B